MTVTDIVELTKSKSKIVIDNEVVFTLYKSEISSFDIRKDGEISEDKVHHILDELLVKRARLRCLNLLKSRDYTRYQLAMKLRQGFYPPAVIENAIAYIASYGYIDDVMYAASYIKYAQDTKSKKQIENDLRKKGVLKEDIEKAYIQCAEKNILVDEDELIQKYLWKKGYNKETSTVEEQRKIIAFLYRKGFSLDRIYKAVEILCDE